MKTEKYISRKERIGGMIYVMTVFIAVVAFASYFMIFSGQSAGVIKQKENIIAKMNRQKTYREDQINFSAKSDSLVRKIERYNPGVSAVYEENDIRFIINEFKQMYETNPWDKRYMVFNHIAESYNMWLVAKQDLWSKKENVRLIKNNLENCQLGLRRRQEELRN